MTTLNEVANELKNKNKKTQLIYAFNGTGKTRLSVEFKNLIDPKRDENDDFNQKKIVYYNAFTQDLFYWDNDIENDIEPKLKIQPNSFTSWIFKEQGLDREVINVFQLYINKKLEPKFNEDFSEVSFSYLGDDGYANNIKISKGEESIFIWSIFYVLMKQIISELNIAESDSRSTHEFDNLEYIFIDDPVSSLDENSLIEMAVNLAELIRSSYFEDNEGLKFIISTHNTLFYNILYNEFQFKFGYMLNRDEEGYKLDEKKGDSNKYFSYYLFIKQVLEDAIKNNEIQRYHFVLLRNLYEKISNFLGYPNWTELLPDDRKRYFTRVLTFTSHLTLAVEGVVEPRDDEKNTVKFLLNNLIDNFNFYKEETN